jgi:hypothetical protein
MVGHQSGYTHQYDVSPDGQRFLINKAIQDPVDAPIHIIVNWPALLGNDKGQHESRP